MTFTLHSRPMALVGAMNADGGLRRIAISGACLLAATALPGAAGAQSTAGYDALGRLACVRYPSGTVLRYDYDAAGNRTVRRTEGGTCASAVGSAAPPAPPPDPVTITVSNPSATIASRGVHNRPVAQLGVASDAAALTITAASTSGSAGSCGAVSFVAASFTYTAPMVTPVGAQSVCTVNYTLAHASSVTATGQGRPPTGFRSMSPEA